MNKEEIIKALEDGYKTLTKEETLEEKSFRMGYQMALNKMFDAAYINYEYAKRNDEAIEFINRYLKLNLKAFDIKRLLMKIKDILKGENNE